MLSRLSTVLLAFAALAFVLAPAGAASTLTLQVRPHAGDESVDISGTAQPGATVDIVLYGTISTDLPVVRVNHLHAQAGPSGAFALNAPVAANFIRGSVLTVQASTPDGASASARMAIHGTGSEFIPSMDSTPNTAPF